MQGGARRSRAIFLSAIFAVLSCAAQGGRDVPNGYDDFANSWRQYVAQNNGGAGGFDESGAPVQFSGAIDPTDELRRRFGIPGEVSNAQIEEYFRTHEMPGPQGNQSAWHQLGDVAKQYLQFAGIGLGGPIGGPIAAANASGVSNDLGIPPALQFAAQLGGTAYSGGPNMPNPDAPPAPPPPASGTPPMQLAQAPGTTMTDVTSGLQGGGGSIPLQGDQFDDLMRGQDYSKALNARGLSVPLPTSTLPTGESVYDQTTGNAAQPATDKSKTNPDGTQAPAGTNPDQPAAPAKPQSSLSDNLKTAAYGTAAAGAIYGALSPRNGAANGQAAADQLAETEQQRQARVTAATDSVNSAFAPYDDNYYNSIADAYKNFEGPLYNEQVTEARRTLPMSVPSTQSSAYLRKARQLETDVQRGQTDLDSQAIQQSQQRRGEIDAQKSDLLNMATAGADASTVADAAGQRAQLYAAPPQFSPIANLLFQQYATDAGNFALAQNANSAGSAPRIVQPLTFARSPSSSQRIIA